MSIQDPTALNNHELVQAEHAAYQLLARTPAASPEWAEREAAWKALYAEIQQRGVPTRSDF